LDDCNLSVPTPSTEGVNHTQFSHKMHKHLIPESIGKTHTEQESVTRALNDLKQYKFTDIYYRSSTVFKGLKAIAGCYSAPERVFNTHTKICDDLKESAQSELASYHDALGIKKFICNQDVCNDLTIKPNTDRAPTTIYAISLYSPTGQNAVLYGFINSDPHISAFDWDKIYARAQRLHLDVILQSRKTNEIASFTSRENDIMRCIIKGKSNNDIARYLGISVHTVNGHINRIFLKTNTSDRLSASLYALQNALIS